MRRAAHDEHKSCAVFSVTVLLIERAGGRKGLYMEYNEETEERGLRRLSSNALKLTACVCMAVDHIGIVFMDNNDIMRAVGRLAFPVFAFLLVQGLLRTSDVRRYLLRLGIFAVVSEIPFDLAMHDTIWYPGAQNIFFTLTAGLFAIYAMDSRGPIGRWKVEIVLAAALLAEFLRFDYGMAGVGIIVMFYLIEKERSGADAYTLAYFNKKQNIEIVVLSSLVYILCLGMNQLYALLAMIPVNMYSGERGRMRLKYFFYLFYPLHLLLIWFIWKIIH